MTESANASSGSQYEIALKLTQMVLKAEGKLHANHSISATREELLTLYSECLWATMYQRRPAHEHG